MHSFNVILLKAINQLCDENKSCLVSPYDILSFLPPKKAVDLETLESNLIELSDDGYIEIICSERKGEKMYVISVTEKSFKQKKELMAKRKDVYWKVLLAFIGALCTFIFGLILRAIAG